MAILLPDDAYEYDATTFRSGAIVHGRYEIVSLLGHGSSGAVYKAVDAERHRTVALKHTVLAAEDARQAFVREAEVLTRLRHPGIPEITDYFLDQSGQFLVMQFVAGEDLADTLRKRKRSLPLHEVLHWARLLLDVLMHLHEQDPPIVHGDIKPGNLKPTENGELMLLDFELSKDAMGAARAASGRTLAGHTARYSAPEWLEGKQTDARTDLYALGATLYHLLAGTPPPSAEERERALRIGQPDPLPRLDSVNPGVPQAVAAAVERATALDPARRFARADEMRQALFAGTRDDSVFAALSSQARRVDAAVPSWVSSYQSFDCHVQARFADSPRLGREDWPVEHGSAQTGRTSDVTRLVFHPVPGTGGLAPAALVVKLATADFAVEGETEQRLEVPPDDYSPRVQFRLRTTQGGACRINIEIYTEDGIGLGVIPLDLRVGGELARPPLRVGHLVLKVATRDGGQPAVSAQTPTARAVAPVTAAQLPAAPRIRAPFETPAAEADVETPVTRAEDEPAWRWRDVFLAALALVVALLILSFVASSVRRSQAPRQGNPASSPKVPATSAPAR